MAYFRTLSRLQTLLDLFSRDERWLIAINADPDAMSSAMALKRIMMRRVQEVVIGAVNEVTRPDNLAMIRYSRLKMEELTPELVTRFDRFALVDSQPSHHPLFGTVPFSVIIDHHPLSESVQESGASYVVVKPEYGATATLMTEHLYALDIQPSRLLATALLFGIKTDTASFERHCSDIDLRAYQYLARFADKELLARIVRSEFHQSWLEFFAKACTHLYPINKGNYTFVGDIENPDILVVIADFFMRVYEILWVAVAGVYNNTVVVVFRSDGVFRDVGQIASASFGDIGSAGGHKSMARAEFDLAKAEGKDPELFVWQQLSDAYEKRAVAVGKIKKVVASEEEPWQGELPD